MEVITSWIVQFLFGAALLALGGILKSFHSKLSDLDVRTRAAIDESRVRQILEDKLALLASQNIDIKDDIREIKQRLDAIFRDKEKA